MNEPAANVVEIPRWVRVVNAWPFGGPRPSRRDILLIEMALVGLATVLFVVSFLVSAEPVASMLRAGAAFELFCAYLVSWQVRINDTYRMWPGSPNVAPERPRTWRGRIAEYAFAFGVAGLVIAIVCWIAL